MKLYIKHSKLINEIDEKNTQWCCKEFKKWGQKRITVYDGNIYVGEAPEVVFDWNKFRFERVTHSIMTGCGFGDGFWGDEALKICPFCGGRIEPLQFYINGEKWHGRRKNLIKKIKM